MKKIALLLVIALLIVPFSGCREVDKVSYNVSKEADNFNVTRRISVINMRSDKPVFELIGNFSLQNNSTNELEVIVETSQNVYKKHFIYLNEWSMYVVEDVSGAYVDKFHYEVNFLPEMIVPITFTNKD